MKSGNIDYIPFNKALIVKEVEDDEEQLKRELEELNSEMRQKFLSITHTFNARFDFLEVILI